MTLFAIAVTLIFATGIAVLSFNFGLLEYLNILRQFVHFSDFITALLKGMMFGSVIPVIACAYGFQCKGGAEGVGTATTEAVVTSTIAVISLDFILTYLFTWLNL